MKKTIFILSSLFLTVIMQAQDRPQPKPGPAPVINIGKPETFELKNGLKVMVVENHKLPRVSYNLTLDNAPYAEGDKKGVAEITSALIGSGTKKMSKDAFNEEIDFLGANIGFSANGAYASGLSKYSDRILELMADGALNSVFTQEELDKEKTKLIEGLKTQEKSVQAVASRVEDVLVFGKNHPNGEYLTEESINKVTLNDAIMNYTTYFVPANAYLVITGDVKFKDVKKAVEKYFGSWKKATAPVITYADPKDVQYTQINFVDMPNAVQSEISLVNVSNLKMTDKDYFAVLLANQIIGGDFNSYLNMNLREAHGWTYGARSNIRGDKYVGKFKSNTQVRNAVTDSAVVEFFKELKRIRTEKVAPDMLKNVKAGYIGNFVMQIQKPGTVARYALLTKTQNLPADFYENYIKNINAVTADDIMRVANKYFLADNTRVIITGKGSDVLPGLEKLGIPMFYFDKFGNQVDKPVAKKAVPAGVTAKTVFDNYIKAIGGDKNAKSVKTVFSTLNGKVQGIDVTMTRKSSAAGKKVDEVKGMGQTLSKEVFDGTKGYESAQGQKEDYSADKIANAKFYSLPFPELTLATKPGITLSGIESIDGKEAYAIKDGKKTLYYDVTTGLKLAEANTEEMQGQQMTQVVSFSDYKDVKGVKVPFKTTLNVGIEIELTASDVKINEGVSDADFK
ncbi:MULTISPECIES: M16 family metallopeptidase [Flavobacterium]|jgi:zinc protease|nr:MULTISPECIES: pitrilysin family protein [Flavobacterium]KQS50123.1 peptidase M16 [Flavobacterium sp. Leaf359]MDQ7962286.1 pitrilysin family protein [Flavobacterium lindanitolerans]RLJ35252.1 putative Zn-dependent peptidase [Flavobacterium lindanitolerans]